MFCCSCWVGSAARAAKVWRGPDRRGARAKPAHQQVTGPQPRAAKPRHAAGDGGPVQVPRSQSRLVLPVARHQQRIQRGIDDNVARPEPRPVAVARLQSRLLTLQGLMPVAWVLSVARLPQQSGSAQPPAQRRHCARRKRTRRGGRRYY